VADVKTGHAVRAVDAALPPLKLAGGFRSLSLDILFKRILNK